MVSRRTSLVSASKTMELDAKAKEMIKMGEDVINLTAGEPDFPTPRPIVEAAKRFLENGHVKYTDPRGIQELREKIARKLREKYGKDVSADHVVLTNGAKQALYNAFLALLDPGDEVVVFTPAWVSYIPQIVFVGGEVRIVETHFEEGFQPSLSTLKKSITERTKVVLVNSPNNPTGVVYRREFMRELVDLARERNFYVVSDEVYEPLVYTENFTSILEVSEDLDKIVYINGFSKSHSMTGWRVGYVVSSKEVISAVAKIQSHTTSCINTITQYACLEAFNVDTSEMLEEFRRRRDFVIEQLRRIGLAFVEPEGAFYVFVKVPGDDVVFCENLLEKEKVVLVPGSAFLTPGFVRLSFAVSMEKLAEGMRRIERFLERFVG